MKIYFQEKDEDPLSRFDRGVRSEIHFLVGFRGTRNFMRKLIIWRHFEIQHVIESKKSLNWGHLTDICELGINY